MSTRTRFRLKIVVALIMALLIEQGALTIYKAALYPESASWRQLGLGTALLLTSYALHLVWKRIR
jgi:hypothetical protein